MPFTLSHAAAVFPFRKFKPVWPALVTGTFAPDLQYFVWIADEDRSGHHFPGVFLLTLPMALLALWLFERFVKGPAIELLPDGVQRRLQDKVESLSFQGWRQFASIVGWIAVGISTHIMWDWFTHSRTWITAHWELFSHKVPVPLLHPMAVSKILQHASSALGLLALVVWFALWYVHTAPVARTRQRQFSPLRKLGVVIVLGAIALFLGYPLAVFRLQDQPLPFSSVVFIVTVFEAVTLVFGAEMLIYGVARTMRVRAKSAPGDRFREKAVSSRAEAHSE